MLLFPKQHLETAIAMKASYIAYNMQRVSNLLQVCQSAKGLGKPAMGLGKISKGFAKTCKGFLHSNVSYFNL